jgi:hypothetical protein
MSMELSASAQPELRVPYGTEEVHAVASKRSSLHFMALFKACKKGDMYAVMRWFEQTQLTSEDGVDARDKVTVRNYRSVSVGIL